MQSNSRTPSTRRSPSTLQFSPLNISLTRFRRPPPSNDDRDASFINSLNLLFFIRYPTRSRSFAKTQKFRRRVPFVPFFRSNRFNRRDRDRRNALATFRAKELAFVIIFTFRVLIVKGGSDVFKRSRKNFAQKTPNAASTTRGYRSFRPQPPPKLTFAAPKFQNAFIFQTNVLILTKITRRAAAFVPAFLPKFSLYIIGAIFATFPASVRRRRQTLPIFSVATATT